MYSKVTTMLDYAANKQLMTGTEEFRIKGKAVPKKTIQNIIRLCAGLKRNWNCIEKAIITREVLGRGTVSLGSLYIDAPDYKSNYGFMYRPEANEFHAWVQLDKLNIVDVALPGVIENGLNLMDEVGPFLYGREPVILAGKPAKWMRYKKEGVM